MRLMRIGGAAVVILGLASLASANLLTNGGFESQPNFGSGVSGDAGYSALTGSQIPGWTIAAGHAATVHNTVLYPFISGSYSINMDGEGFGGGNANLYQDVATTLGGRYSLSFDWQGWMQTSACNLGVFVVDPATNATIVGSTYAYDAALHHETFTFLATGSAVRVLLVESPESGFNDNGFMVDNFDMVAVPAPSAGLMLAAGVLVRGRRRR